MVLFRLFATFGVIAIFGLVTLSAAVVGYVTPDPTGTVWVAISAFMGLMTFVMAVTLYQFRLTTRTRTSTRFRL